MEFFKENHANLSDEKSSPAPDSIKSGAGELFYPKLGQLSAQFSRFLEIETAILLCSRIYSLKEVWEYHECQ